MTFQEPNPDSLKAMAGWAISKKANASNEQVLALEHFKDGCSELAECCPAPAAIAVSGTVSKAPSVVTRYESAPVERVEIPEDVLVLQRFGMVQDCKGVDHKFDIRTQKCRSCGLTYREATGRKPELMP